ncbi:PBP1A family penicillin-binding protein [Sutcliffiella cohnii]|uniref:transglycosylase domain-containing protein n=1 Tax=Sutcliffiella cohnii TaxID=33932 RepID=UPI002E1DE0BF|nr:PBP1A family penicillin-binding protein [Sutcliffiella cohnii]
MASRLERKKKKGFNIKFVLLLVGIFTLILLVGMQFHINTRDVSALLQPLPQSTIVYDRNGDIASKFSSNQVEGVNENEIADVMKLAIVAVEDQRFYEHDGFDLIGTLRAALKNVKERNVLQGGSTITQQLVKNVFLTNEKTFKRKLDEFFLAKKVEQEYTKSEILSLYLNQIYFGEGAWGIKKAAQVYFGKEPIDLSVAEAATLAGLVKAPSALSPIKNKDGAKERRNVVLQLMHNQGFISDRQFEEARNEKLEIKERKVDQYRGKYASYIDHIVTEAMNLYGLTENELLSGGYHIYTEMDQSVQQTLEDLYSDVSNFPVTPDGNVPESAGILLHAETGGVLALVGGRDYQFRHLNRATSIKRQPGSIVKPLFVYIPALENGYEPHHMLNDTPININGYSPQNHTRSYQGEVSMYNAVIHSYNIPAVSLLHEMGIKYGIDAASRFNIPITDDDHHLSSLALGGFSKGVAPIHMAEAYTTFANKGVKTNAHAISKIVDCNGKTVATFEGEKEQIISEEVSQKMTFMLKGAVEEGGGRNASIVGREVAGKTGSTQVNFDGVPNAIQDQWFVGYTPEVVGAFWIGFDRTDESHYVPVVAGAGNTAATLFSKTISLGLQDLPSTSFSLGSYLKAPPVKKVDNNKKEQKKQKKTPPGQKKKEEKKKNKKNKKGKKKDD